MIDGKCFDIHGIHERVHQQIENNFTVFFWQTTTSLISWQLVVNGRYLLGNTILVNVILTNHGETCSIVHG